MFVLKKKFAKKPFKSIAAKKIELLELGHSNLADFKHNEQGRKEMIYHICG